MYINIPFYEIYHFLIPTPTPTPVLALAFRGFQVPNYLLKPTRNYEAFLTELGHCLLP